MVFYRLPTPPGFPRFGGIVSRENPGRPETPSLHPTNRYAFFAIEKKRSAANSRQVAMR